MPPEITGSYGHRKMRGNDETAALSHSGHERSSHCNFSGTENAAAVKTLLERIETGLRWQVPNRNG